MTQKHHICPEKVRRIPAQFSWIDHRLVRNRRIDLCSHQALALYLFLVTVGDQKGLSYYSDHSVSNRLLMDSAILSQARNELVQAGLVVYQKPLYQVLSLAPAKIIRSHLDAPLAVGQILKQLAGGIL